MAIFGIGKEWLFLFGGCAVAGVIFWVGIDGLTVKTVLMWSFIGFGFLTVILHACGSPIGGLVANIVQAATEKEENKRLFTEEEIAARRELSLRRKQGLHNQKAESYQENILKPREEALRAKREDDIHRFTGWRDRGHKLGYAPEQLEEFEYNECLEEQALLSNEMDPDSLVGFEHVAPEINLEERKGGKHENSEQEQLTLRRRRKEGKSESPSTVTTDKEGKEKENIPEEPCLGTDGVITIALRGPTGKMTKRRFCTCSQLQSLVDYAEWLGYPPSDYVILKTYPREPLTQLTNTFTEAGLIHDTAFVIEEI